MRPGGWTGVLAGTAFVLRAFGAPSAAGTAPGTTSADEVRTVAAELARSIEGLRLPSAPAPYHAQARWTRAQVLSVAGAYGGVTEVVHERQQTGTVRLRVGAPNLDDGNFLDGDDTEVRFEPSLAPDPGYMARRVWLAADASFRAATRRYARKTGVLARLSVDVPVPDFGAPPPRVQRIRGADPVAAPDVAGVRRAVQRAGRRFARTPEVDGGNVHVAYLDEHQVFVSTDGVAADRVRRRGLLAVVAHAQAEDGMWLDHGRAIHLAGPLPDEAALVSRLEELVEQVIAELAEQVAAPRLEEEYDGPILFEPVAAAQLLAALVPPQASGTPSPLSEGGRVVDLEPAWQRRLGKSVMPSFLSLVDDPAADPFGGYDIDAEGFVPVPLRLVDHGRLTSLLMTRTPGRVLRSSNGRARVTPSLDVGPQVTNLRLLAHGRRRSRRQLEAELLRRAREDGYEFAYVVELLRDAVLLGPPPRDSAGVFAGTGKVRLPLPARLWRVDGRGRRTLVRGAVLAPVSMRVLRRIRAVGRDPQTTRLRLPVGYEARDPQLGVDGALSHTVDVTVTAPALLLDGFELLAERGEQERPPILPRPLHASGAVPPP